ncbi:MAG: hypothetical protein FJW39_27545 [Acidobacteria bacterium]|nr:hypothetical protein [Acidobacteriota bacterium]
MIAALLFLLALPVAGQKVHELCAACHNQHFDDLQKHKHFAKGMSCDACHGESKAHREAGGNQLPDKVAAPAEQPTLCGSCHADQGKAYSTSKHGKAVVARSAVRAATCTTCHGTHAARAPAGIQQQCNRCHQTLPESCKKPPPAATAKVACVNCHDQHTLAVKR